MPPGKGEIGGLTFFHFFFNCGIKRQYPKDCQAVQNLRSTFWRRSKKKQKKRVSCNPRPHRHLSEHFPGTVTDFTACSLPQPLAFTFDLLPKSDDVVLFYFIYLNVSKSLFIYLPLLQTTVYVPHPCTKLLWRHFIKKDVTGRIYASITPHL